MSGWTLETDDRPVGSDNNRQRNKTDTRVTTRKAFFPDDGDDDARVITIDDRRDSFTLASTRGVSRRSQRGRAELVVNDDSDDDSSSLRLAQKQFAAAPPPHVSSSLGKSTAKSDEVGQAEIVQSVAVIDGYLHSLVREFLATRYSADVAAAFEKELAPSIASALPIDTIHARIISASDASKWAAVTRLEQVITAWDTRTHRRRVAISPSTRSLSSSPSNSTTTKASKTSRTKPQLRVSVAVEAPMLKEKGEAEEGDYNRLNHPGHTPKAQTSELLAAVIGKPGSTPRASASELRALGFDDIDDTDTAATGPASLLRVRHVESDGGEDVAIGDEEEDDDDGDGLSNYAKRKRAASRHHKHVSLGDAGRTPTKEYIFFRETPPRFVTESIDAAEDALRSNGGNPGYVAASVQKMERFVELQSSDVAKYSVGLRVENLGSQRNVTGLVSKLYGSRQCGSAGPGTIIIDTWEGSDVEPSTEALGDDDF